MSFKAIIQRVHLWVGLLLGVQVLLWMASGVVMTWFDIELVRGERAMFSAPAPELEAGAYASPGGIIAQLPGASSVELRTFLNRTVYEAHSAQGAALFDAKTGEKISISEDMARDVAMQDFIGAGEIKNIALMNDPPHEYRGERPVWRVDFNDRLSTRLYISSSTGKVISRRNAIWRLYDFFWMLHIMDYGAREDFNNPLVKFAAATGMLFALSGLMMLVFKERRRQIASDVNFLLSSIKRKRRKQNS